jgi:SAM-dependent methyltransferase
MGWLNMLRNMVKSAYLRLWILPRIHRTYKNLSITETFQKIYAANVWGDNGEPFFSGTGSRCEIAELYSTFVIDFIRDHQVLTVIDFGCGDFTVGRRIVETTGIHYSGVDVVPELIERHKIKVQDSRVSFLCADITTDPLPAADLCLIRQVFQHLSNAEIAKVIARLDTYLRGFARVSEII